LPTAPPCDESRGGQAKQNGGGEESGVGEKIMWLPKDERRLLSYYYRRINKVETDQYLEMNELIKLLRKKQAEKSKREIILGTYNILENVNNLLSQRGLIKWENRNPDSIYVLKELPKTSESLSLPENTTVTFRITLTLKGYDLGRKYSSWWARSGLWFTEYKDHWFWLILSFLGGIIGALIVNWLSDGS
jgi:hypothetical protein